MLVEVNQRMFSGSGGTLVGTFDIQETPRLSIQSLNLFVPNAPFLYPLKTSENLGVRKCIRNKWVNELSVKL